ncbi:MAG: glutathione S-transferase family protein [Amphritea sp.]
MIKVYGGVFSRASMVMCALEELGLEYESVDMLPRSQGTQTQEYKALNPTGKLPTLVDGDLVLWETQAILFYLARKYGAEKLWVQTLEQEAELFRWSLFISNQIEAPALDMLLMQKYAKDGQVDNDKMAKLSQLIDRFMPVLEAHMAGRVFLAADHLTVVDIHAGGVLAWPKLAGYDFDRYPSIAAWLRRILALASQKRVRARAAG